MRGGISKGHEQTAACPNCGDGELTDKHTCQNSLSSTCSISGFYCMQINTSRKLITRKKKEGSYVVPRGQTYWKAQQVKGKQPEQGSEMRSVLWEEGVMATGRMA